MQARAAIDPAAIRSAYAACRDRLADHPSRLLAEARRMDDETRADAFFVVYESLRVAGPARLPRPLGRSRSFDRAEVSLRVWRDGARLCYQGQPDSADTHQIALADAMTQFQIPVTPWEELESGLLALAQRDAIPDIAASVARARLLAVAPFSVMFRVLCARRGVHRYRQISEVDIAELAHDPAVFAYLVGVAADVFTELEHLRPMQSSIPDEFLTRHHLTAQELLDMRGLQVAPARFRDLMHDISFLAWNFYDSGVAKIGQSAAHLSPESISHLDGFLGHYKTVLQDLERTHFSPAHLAEVTRSLEPRIITRIVSATPTPPGGTSQGPAS